ncbi:MAG: sodium/solute symporter [Elusimicrobia bacterium]|nr:sodium/solute symporter [Elusimicrobiota bacterium]
MGPETWFSNPTMLDLRDYSVLLAFLVFMFGLGWWHGRKEEGTADFFLGRRSIPWWAACMSFVATEISAMTIIGVPATGFRENWNYAQFFIGSAASRIVIAFLFIPAFYHFNCTTIYEFLKHRFGAQTQYAATGFFFVTRVLASSVRLMAACVAVAVLVGWDKVPVIALFVVVGALYIGHGGIKAVVWTNVVQAVAFMTAGAATLVYLASHVEGGAVGIMAAAEAAGKLQVFNWGPSVSEPGFLQKFFSDPNIIWVAVLNGFFGSMAAFGTDHEMMQRLLTVETRAASQRTMLLSIVGSFVVLMIFLSVGTGLFVFYQQNPALPLPEGLDKIYPHFTTSVMPAFMRGLVLAAVVLASIDSPLSSLTASFVTDIYKPLIKSDADEAHYMRVSRLSICAFAVLLGVLAYVFSHVDKMLWVAFKIGGVTYGSLLGVFLLGLLTKRPANRANIWAMTVMAVVNAVLLYLSELKVFPLGWSWLVILGTFGTFGLAWALGPVLDPERQEPQAGG